MLTDDRARIPLNLNFKMSGQYWPYLCFSLVAFCCHANGLSVKLDARLDFVGFRLVPESGTIEYKNNPSTTFSISSSSTVDIVPGQGSGSAGVPQHAGFDLRFVMHPDERHKIGDPGLIRFELSATGDVNSSGSGDHLWSQGEVDLTWGLVGIGGAPIVLDLLTVERAYYYNPLFERDFQWNGFTVPISFGYEYIFYAYGSVYSSQMYSPPEDVPDSLGFPAAAGALVLVCVIKSGFRIRPRERNFSRLSRPKTGA